MAEIWATLGDAAKSASYSSTASSYMISWQEVGMSADGTHLLLEVRGAISANSGDMFNIVLGIQYNNQTHNVLAYNLAADKLLGTGIVPASLMTLQSTYYANNFGEYFRSRKLNELAAHPFSIADLYGFPIDSRLVLTPSISALLTPANHSSPYASAMWSLWTTTTTSTAVRDTFISKLHNWLTSGLTSVPFGDRFLDDTGATSPNRARPGIIPACS
ncbi:Glutaminase A [Mycena venus]|uniref:Glutaminase A n=1 Tax=Mycena venus TaxID=2733690 RepID=A0A8H6WXA8_9AGAR|nr:Glutaminase A [Mycena venus]